MLISLNWLKDYVDIPVEAAELENILTMLGMEVEDVQDAGAQYKGFFIGFVQKRKDHPNADKLSVCEVTLDGTESRTIICGAHNVDAGQKVIVAIEGAVVPNGGFEIGRRKIRGVESNGMICSELELGMGEDHDGIMVLPEDTPLGMPLADYLEANDVVFDLSITPNRADALSHIGVARDLAAHFNTELRIPEAEVQESAQAAAELVKLDIRDTENCPRYAGRIVKGVTVGESPDWLKRRLEAVGLRPRNNIVDITNYVLMECGHPLHGFDMAEIGGNTVVVQRAQEGEKFTTLDEKERTLDANMLMICDAERNVAIAGVMGGQNSEISEKTTDVFIESAWFKPSSVRRTARKLGISSDASYRFERGTDVNNVEYAVNRAAQLMAEIAGGEVLSGIIDAYPTPIVPGEVSLRYHRVGKLLGVEISPDTSRELLQRLGFSIVRFDDEQLTVRVPSYRVDIHQEADLIEEVARLYNYDNIPPADHSEILLVDDGYPVELTPPPLFKKISNWLQNTGFQEISTANMLSPEVAALFTEHPVQLANPLGEELSIMRPSLIPAVLKVVEHNVRFGSRDLALFEIGKTFEARDDKDNFLDGVCEKRHLIIGLTGNAAGPHFSDNARPLDFYDIKGVFESLVDAMGFKKLRVQALSEAHPHFGPDTVAVSYKNDVIAYVGELAAKLVKRYEIDAPVFVIDLDLEVLKTVPTSGGAYTRVSPYPNVRRDLAFVLDEVKAAGDVRTIIAKNGGNDLKDVSIFDVFTDAALGEGKKSVAYALTFNSPERTLQDADVDKQIERIVAAVQKQAGGVLR